MILEVVMIKVVTVILFYFFDKTSNGHIFY